MNKEKQYFNRGENENGYPMRIIERIPHQRFKEHGVAGLEDMSRRPKNTRTKTVNPEIVEEIKRIR